MTVLAGQLRSMHDLHSELSKPLTAEVLPDFVFAVPMQTSVGNQGRCRSAVKWERVAPPSRRRLFRAGLGRRGYYLPVQDSTGKPMRASLTAMATTGSF
jgi:hypothetical protein